MRNKALTFSILLVFMGMVTAGGAWLYQNRAGLVWRLDSLQSRLKYALDPPAEVVFLPEATHTPPGLVQRTTSPLPALPQPAMTHTPRPSVTIGSSPTPTWTQTPLPDRAELSGLAHFYQDWNNCGPANLAMALSFWGWDGDQADTARVLRPSPRDRNVMPPEMAAYVATQTGLRAKVRVGGDLDTLRALIAAGLPVLIERGYESASFEGWMGHYQVLYAYQDEKTWFLSQDSYKGPGTIVPYSTLPGHWRAFNYTYIVIYPEEQESQVSQILAEQDDPLVNRRHAAELARQEIARLQGRDLYFAYFNHGTNLAVLEDYQAATQAFDAAFALYPQLPVEIRPWRMLWYQDGPYVAYYHSGRYQDVVNLATTVLTSMGAPLLEESYYWRARAYLALGDLEAARSDLDRCLQVHPGFELCLDELERL